MISVDDLDSLQSDLQALQTSIQRYVADLTRSTKSVSSQSRQWYDLGGVHFLKLCVCVCVCVCVCACACACVCVCVCVCVCRRIQLLESELVVLNDWQVKRDYNRK